MSFAVDAPSDPIHSSVPSCDSSGSLSAIAGQLAKSAVLLAYSWISLYTADHWGAMRFAVPQVARGATIVDAYLDVYVDTGSQEDDPNVAITSEANANPAALVSLNNNISSRPRGAASVTWNASNLGTGV